MPEATEAQIRALAVLEASWNDPVIGPTLQKNTKTLYPDAKTNDDVFGPVVAPLKAENEKLAKRLEKFEEERAAERKAAEESSMKRSLDDALTAARKNYNLTEEGFDKMVARMKETGNYSDADAAAAWVASKTPPAPVAGPSWKPQSMNPFGSKKFDEALADLHRDPAGYMDEQLAQFVSDPDGYVAETFGGRAA
jgi:hypothetical protein